MMDFMIPFSKGDIPARLRYPNAERPYPGILLLHGFTSCKEGDGRMLELLAERLVSVGYVVLQMDFCKCNQREYTLERMGQEAKTAFAYLQGLSMVEPNACGIIAHSLGCRVTSMIANDAMKMIVLLNGALGNKYRAPWFLKENMYRMQEECRLYGKTSFVNSNQEVVELYQEFFMSLENSDVQPIYEYPNSLCIVYGEQDPTVDPRVSIETYHSAHSSDKKLLSIPFANHTFQAKTLDYTIWNHCMDQMVPWILETLRVDER